LKKTLTHYRTVHFFTKKGGDDLLRFKLKKGGRGTREIEKSAKLGRVHQEFRQVATQDLPIIAKTIRKQCISLVGSGESNTPEVLHMSLRTEVLRCGGIAKAFDLPKNRRYCQVQLVGESLHTMKSIEEQWATGLSVTPNLVQFERQKNLDKVCFGELLLVEKGTFLVLARYAGVSKENKNLYCPTSQQDALDNGARCAKSVEMTRVIEYDTAYRLCLSPKVIALKTLKNAQKGEPSWKEVVERTDLLEGTIDHIRLMQLVAFNTAISNILRGHQCKSTFAVEQRLRAIPMNGESSRVEIGEPGDHQGRSVELNEVRTKLLDRDGKGRVFLFPFMTSNGAVELSLGRHERRCLAACICGTDTGGESGKARIRNRFYLKPSDHGNLLVDVLQETQVLKDKLWQRPSKTNRTSELCRAAFVDPNLPSFVQETSAGITIGLHELEAKLNKHFFQQRALQGHIDELQQLIERIWPTAAAAAGPEPSEEESKSIDALRSTSYSPKKKVRDQLSPRIATPDANSDSGTAAAAAKASRPPAPRMDWSNIDQVQQKGKSSAFRKLNKLKRLWVVIGNRINRIKTSEYRSFAASLARDPCFELSLLPELNLQQMRKRRGGPHAGKRVSQLVQTLSMTELSAAIESSFKRTGKVRIKASEWATTKASPGPVQAHDGTSVFVTHNIGPSKFKQHPLNNHKVMRDAASAQALKFKAATSKQVRSSKAHLSPASTYTGN
jgi:hypothetical protein